MSSPLVYSQIWPLKYPHIYISQLWQRGNFEPPALVVRQMQMKGVHLVHGHDFEKTNDKVFVKEVASDIEHQSAVGHARRIHNTNLSIHMHALLVCELSSCIWSS